MPDAKSETELVLERQLDAPRAAVWRCWTEPDLLEQWFCPKPWRVTDAKIDLRPGGRFDTVMNGPDGETIPNRGQFVEVDPGHRLVFTDAFVGDWQPGSGTPFMAASITFADAPGGGTLYRASARHWSVEARERHEAMGFHEGWGVAADQLETLAREIAGRAGKAAS